MDRVEMRPVTDEQRPSPWMAGVHWGSTLVEPLLSPAQRDRLEADLHDAIAADPVWGAHYVVGVVTDLAATLPAADPWRTAERAETGATLEGRPFGTVTDHHDLVPLLAPNPSIDVALVAVAEPIDPATAAFIASSFAGRDEALTALGELTATTPSDIYRIGTEAIRTLTYRRRCYRGWMDTWPLDSTWWWAEQSARILSGDTDTDTLVAISAERVLDETIPESDYDPDPEWAAARSTTED